MAPEEIGKGAAWWLRRLSTRVAPSVGRVGPETKKTPRGCERSARGSEARWP
ncbi:hypothetical protein STTU_1733 [Streptomyces sp. Tu6071]|nr:hypothetical protein STTU_1733 [Streptomyces sp. Tu6071]